VTLTNHRDVEAGYSDGNSPMIETLTEILSAIGFIVTFALIAKVLSKSVGG